MMIAKICCLALVIAAALATKLYPPTPLPPQWQHSQQKINMEEEISFVVGLRRRNPAEMDTIFWEVSTPTNPKYGQHLKHEEMRRLVSPGPQAIQATLKWLSDAGITTTTVGAHGDYIQAKASLGRIENLLGQKFKNFMNKKTKRVLARIVDGISVRDDISKYVEVIGGLNGFPAEAFVPRAHHIGSPQTNVTPTVLFQTYNATVVPEVPSGQSSIQSFFQAQGQFVNQTDLRAFCDTFLNNTSFAKNISKQCQITKYVGNNSDISPGENMESSLDSQYILSTGALAETWVYSFLNMDFCGDLMQWAMDVFENVATAGKFPQVISMSYGSQSAPNMCLGPDVARLAQDIQKMGTMGISVMIASGDDGSGEFYGHGMYYNYGLLSPSFPASIPYCTAVGATTFVSGNSGEEMGTTQFGSGGGFSYDYVAPSYQSEVVSQFLKTSAKLPPIVTYNGTGRGTPDIALLGEGYNVFDQLVDNQGIGGTSCSTPVFSGFVQLLNRIRLQKGKTLGFLNPLLYAHPEIFNDVTKGTNDVNGDGYGWYAMEGWDPVTGLGTPNIGKLMEVVKNLP